MLSSTHLLIWGARKHKKKKFSKTAVLFVVSWGRFGIRLIFLLYVLTISWNKIVICLTAVCFKEHLTSIRWTLISAQGSHNFYNVSIHSGLERSCFDNKSTSFEEHVKGQHNMWHYLYFIVLINVKDPTEFTGPESYVYRLVKVRSISFIIRYFLTVSLRKVYTDSHLCDVI